MKTGLKNYAIAAFAVLMLLSVASVAGAQDKMDKCKNIRIEVDVNKGSGNWDNGAYELALMETGGGWVINSGDMKGKNVPAKKGQKLRFNFNDGNGHMVDVTCSTKSGSCNARPGSRPAIVLVDVTGANTRAAVNFEITGSPNAKAKINGCPGGNFYLEIE